MKHLAAKMSEFMEHWVEIDVPDEMALEIVQCYKEGNEERLIEILQPVVDAHGSSTSEMSVDFVGFE